MTPRRTRRWVLCAWTALVVTGGGLTLWLQDGTQEAPVSRQEVEPQRDVAPPGQGDLTSCVESGDESVGSVEELRAEEFGVEEFRRDGLEEPHLEVVYCAELVQE
ncbi:hypothetical protein N566_14350 [Streptomycetaceae bacterium MP113-05]|nr:hypothetical protein N566_14350 [Streptomycetaceae bacterium MP113-05]